MARPAPPDLSDSRRPLRGVARSYPAGHRVDAHEHAWGQVLYAVSGMMWLETPDEALPVPPQRAVWLPPGLRHAVRVASELQMRNIYLSPELSRGLEDRTLVLVVGPLLRELIVSLVEQERQSDPTTIGRWPISPCSNSAARAVPAYAYRCRTPPTGACSRCARR